VGYLQNIQVGVKERKSGFVFFQFQPTFGLHNKVAEQLAENLKKVQFHERIGK
jgi:hypothetical protein